MKSGWQFHHVMDVAPTILKATGLPEPLSVKGVEQSPIEGVTMLYLFNEATRVSLKRVTKRSSLGSTEEVAMALHSAICAKDYSLPQEDVKSML